MAMAIDIKVRNGQRLSISLNFQVSIPKDGQEPWALWPNDLKWMVDKISRKLSSHHMERPRLTLKKRIHNRILYLTPERYVRVPLFEQCLCDDECTVFSGLSQT